MKLLTEQTYREALHELRASLSRYQHKIDCGEGTEHTAVCVGKLQVLIAQMKEEAGE